MFTVELPLTAGQIDELHARQAAPKPRIMVVDDCPEDREWAVEALGMAFRSVALSDAEWALEACDDSYAAVLADYRIGAGRDGLWLLSRVAERFPSAARFLMTGAPDEACLDAERSGLLRRLLPKPLRREQMERMLEGLRELPGSGSLRSA